MLLTRLRLLHRQVTPPSEKRPWLVFTSAGDRSNVAQWIGGSRLFDVCVVYYGDEAEPACARAADKFIRRKGGEFPNLKAAALAEPSYFAAREAVLVMDDDLEIDCNAINTLFELRKRLDAWVLQPAYDGGKGKSSHEILRSLIPAKSSSRVRAGTDMAALLAAVEARKYVRVGEQGEHTVRYVNFIEVTCPLFRADVLHDFLEAYDGRLVGWGVDYWFCQRLLGFLDFRGRPDDKSRRTCLAVVDSCVCVNPMDGAKKGDSQNETREIDSLQGSGQRAASWSRTALRCGLEEQYPLRAFQTVSVPPNGKDCPPRPLPPECKKGNGMPAPSGAEVGASAAVEKGVAAEGPSSRPLTVAPREVELHGCTYVLRSVTADDSDGLLAFGLHGLSEASRQLFAPYDWASASLSAELDASIANSLSGHDLHVVACRGTALVAHAFLWSVREAVPELGIAVADAHQRRGLGRSLLLLLEQAAREAGRWALELTTMQQNTHAFAAYSAAGYEALGIIRNPLGCDVTAAFRGEARPTGFADEHHMVRVLDEARRAEILSLLEAKRTKAADMFGTPPTASGNGVPNAPVSPTSDSAPARGVD